MASSKALTVKNLEALGAARLAELLLELSADDAGLKRRIRLELAGASGSAEVVHEVRKRLTALAKARSAVDWNKIKTLAADLETQLNAIVNVIARTDVGEALELLWRFMGLAEPTLYRCDDGNGRLSDIFAAAAEHLAPMAASAAVDPETLANQVFDAVRGNSYGQFDHIVSDMAPVLGSRGLDRLEQLLAEWEREERDRPPDAERRVIGYSGNGPIYEEDLEARRRQRRLQVTRQEIADARGDVDGYIALYDAQARQSPMIAVGIARRLLEAGRAREALEAIEAIGEQSRGGPGYEWRRMRADILDALDRHDEAQSERWNGFAAGLDGRHLRAYLKRLPDFDDIEAEERAMALALAFRDFHVALGFLLEWPALDRASDLILTRSGELNGDHYGLLSPAGEALETRFPLAATLVRRAMIDFTLEHARYKRYGHAARHLLECESVAARITDFGGHPDHPDYVERLKAEHGRKAAFWADVAMT